ncbi:hypothetical protein [Undibacterium sp. TJN19]
MLIAHEDISCMLASKVFANGISEQPTPLERQPGSLQPALERR